MNIGDTVRVQPIDTNKKEWKQGAVKKKLSNHRYEVTTDDGRTYKRNRQFLRKHVRSQEQSSNIPVPISEDSNHSDNVSVENNTVISEHQPVAESVNPPSTGN